MSWSYDPTNIFARMTETVEDVMDGSLRNRPPIGCDEDRLNP